MNADKLTDALRMLLGAKWCTEEYRTAQSLAVAALAEHDAQLAHQAEPMPRIIGYVRRAPFHTRDIWQECSKDEHDFILANGYWHDPKNDFNWPSITRAIYDEPAQEECWCDKNNIGERGVSCGDCPRDYAQPAQAAQPVGVPDGWVMVPREPTNEMLESAASFGGRGGYARQRGDDALAIWPDMLAAAPQPPAQPSVIAPSVQTLPLKSASYEMTTTAQPSADAEDAARYRWLTNHCFDESLFNESEDKCEVDSRIDAARAAEGRS